jgi:hypothetical protein
MLKFKSKLIIVFALVIGIIAFISCEKEKNQNEIRPVQYVDLLFGGSNSLKSSDSILVEAEVISTTPFKLKSDKIIEVNITLQSGIKTYGYVLKSSLKMWEIKNCYALWSSGCFIYGKLITGDNRESIFIPSTSAYDQFMHPDICPGPGEGFAK